MMSKKILHISSCNPFIPPFIDFVRENFEFTDHDFLLYTGMSEKELNITPNIYLAKPSRISMFKYYLQTIIKMQQADKIILHSLFNIRIVQILFFMPWLLKKSYWIMWGGDLYVYQTGERDWKWRVKEFFRRPVIKNMGYFSTTVPGDFQLAKEWYGTKSKFIHNLMYKSHLYRETSKNERSKEKNSKIFIQVGNSADPSNKHFDILEKISRLDLENIKVFCPLSYGCIENKNAVINYGKKMLGDSFLPITEFMTFNEYNKYMDSIDIAIFNHDRQQAMGNIIGLLSLGKKVVLNSNTTPFSFFEEIGITVYSNDDCNFLEILTEQVKEKNIVLMRNYFNAKRLKSSWSEIFYGK